MEQADEQVLRAITDGLKLRGQYVGHFAETEHDAVPLSGPWAGKPVGLVDVVAPTLIPARPAEGRGRVRG